MVWAAGGSIAFLNERAFGDQSRNALVVELLGVRYLRFAADSTWYARPGIRLGFQGLLQAEMPSQVAVEERGPTAAVEVGILNDGIVVPSLTFGAGAVYRFIRLHTEGNVARSGKLDRQELLGLLYAQLGIGIPIEGGRFMVEPYLRLQKTMSDDRSLLQFGWDVTVGF